MNWKNWRRNGVKIYLFAKFFGTVLVVLLCFIPAWAAEKAGKDVLTPFAGEIRPWNPGTPAANQEFSPVRAGIAPHHGLASETLARFYDNLPRSDNVERIILIGPDHFKAGRRNITLCPMPWRTGKGILKTDADALDALSQTGAVGVESLPFRLEHSIGLHIVFIGRYFPDARVVALMIQNSASLRELSRLVPVLSELLAEEGTLLILSMDFSHDKTPDEAHLEDDKSIERILSFRTEALRDLDIDAPAATWLFLEVLKSRGISEGFVLERTNSSEIVDSPDPFCTSYATMLFR